METVVGLVKDGESSSWYLMETELQLKCMKNSLFNTSERYNNEGDRFIYDLNPFF